MKTSIPRTSLRPLAAGLLALFLGSAAGVDAALVLTPDYTDSFLVGSPGPPDPSNPRPDGLYNDNSAGGYGVEDSHGNPARTWTPFSNFSLNSGGGSTCCGYPGNTGNDGAEFGLAQSGGGDFSFAYGLRQGYMVQLDALIPGDRLDVSSVPSAGAGIFSQPSLSVFFRKDSTAGQPHPAFPEMGLPGIGLYNGSKETGLTNEDGTYLLTGVNDTDWHNFAVHFDRPNHRLQLYVDEALKADIDLATFADGIYDNYSNGGVGAGGAGGVFWVDNFSIGSPNADDPVPVSILITQQPASQNVARGSTATFTVVAQTIGAPQEELQYQWQQGGANITDATNASYTTPATTPADDGAQFRCVLTLQTLSVTSSVATLTVVSDKIYSELMTAMGLISQVDYADTFTVGTVARPDGLYNDNASGGYNIEAAYSNPIVTWTPFSNFSFNSGGGSTCCGYPGNGSNAGASPGVAQSGGNDFSILYGLRSSYVVQVDAILPPDRLDISSMSAAGASIFSANSLSVFFRKEPQSIGLFNGAAETPTGVTTGVTDSDWHNYAVHFDRVNDRLGIYVDGVLKTNLNLALFAGGAYANYSTAAVGLGGTFVFWADNFRVGAANRHIRDLDYRDTFTVGTAARPDGLYNNNATGGYVVEAGLPTATWTPFSNFSFNSGAGSTCCGYPGNTGNGGAGTGVAQSGGGDFSLAYGLRSSYVVQTEAVLPPDRLDISSMPAAGAGLGSPNSLSVFFRKEPLSVGLYNGATETPSGVTTGVTDSNWHKYAVHFDHPNNLLGIYVDGVLKTNLNLATFAGGLYANYSNAAVGLGGTFVFWADNFMVGGPEVTLAPGSLSIRRSAGTVAVQWDGPGLLEGADSVTGPWTTLPDAHSPYATTPGDLLKFYRLRQ